VQICKQKFSLFEKKMRTLEQIRRELADRRVPVVAQKTGLHSATIRRILADPAYIPSLRTMMALNAYLGGGNG